MSGATRRATALGLAGLMLAGPALAGCDSSGRERAFAASLGGRHRSTPATLLADSAAGDRAAIASLPPALREAMDLGTLLAPAALRDTARVRCDQLGGGVPGEVRTRLRARLEDGTALVLFARAERATGSLRRVELVRRTPGRGQRGFAWRADEDETSSVEWPAEQGLPPETMVLPRGGPAPRALRALGRRLLVLPCHPPARDRADSTSGAPGDPTHDAS